MRELNDIMELDHVIRVNTDGTITEKVPGVYTPELLMSVADDECGSILAEHLADYVAQAEQQGWAVLSGFSGQSSSAGRYTGPIMHTSEYIGGYLEDHIRTHPGVYVALSVEIDGDPEHPAGWVVLCREK